MKKLRIGLIGAGNIGKVHLEACRALDNVEVAAICDTDPAVLHETADAFGIEKRFSTVEELLAQTQLDAADVCVWNCDHAACSIAALNAGLHVLCEKPMASTVAEAEEMQAAARKNNKLLMIGFVMRFADETRVAKDLIDHGSLGDIYYSKATYLRRHGNPGGWFADKTRSGGGPVIDLGVHFIDLTRYLAGNKKPVSVYAATYDKLKNRPNLKTNVGWIPRGAKPDDVCSVEDLGVAMIRYADGSVMLLETSYSLHTEKDTGTKELFGTKGGLRLDDGIKLYSELNGYMTDIEPKTDRLKDGRPMFEAELAHFADCALNGTPCIAPAEDGVTIMKILDAIYQSASTGHEVLLDDGRACVR